ncbi:MAG: hypothetical protein ACTSUE_23120 [Promethearchaeota archaeon]
MSEIVVVLSYFDRKVGPTAFIEVPENKIGGDVEMVLGQIFDQTTSEGFFWHSISGKFKTSLNYYFEIPSEIARGFKEMLMISIVFTENLSPEKEHEVLSWVIDFAQKLRSKEAAYKAFYYSEKRQSEMGNDQEVVDMYLLVQKWAKELYWSTKEEIRKKSEEEIVANLMINDALLKTIKYLSKRPVLFGDLKQWFRSQDFLRDFDRIISTLEEHKFIFINNIGPETYILLVKDIRIVRVPPDCLVELIEKRDERQPLIDYYITVVQEFFDDYNPKKDDASKLFKIMSQPKHYNLISELRNGPIIKSRITKILRHGPFIATRLNVLDELKAENIIDELEFLGSVYVFLKTDIIINDQFPEYIQKALPADEKRRNRESHLALKRASDDLYDLFSSNGEIPNFEVDDIENPLQRDDDISTEPASIAQEEQIDNESGEDSLFDIIVDEISAKFMENNKALNSSGNPDNDGSQKEEINHLQ